MLAVTADLPRGRGPGRGARRPGRPRRWSAYYPSWETLPHERLSPRSDTVGRRLAVLRRLRHPGDDATNGPLKVVVAPVRSVLQPQVQGPRRPRAGRARARRHRAARGRRAAGWPDAAYSRVDLVEKRGEFAVRGGIVDVFPPTEEHPLRVEFWGDDVEEIRVFSVADQRTLEKVERLWAPPCRELLLTDEVRERAAELGRAHPQLLELTDKIAAGIAVEGMESLVAGARRRDGAARRPDARRHPRAGARPRAGPHPRPRPGRDQRGVPRRQLGGRRRRAARRRSTSARRRTAPSPTSASTASRPGKPWWTVSPFGIDDDDSVGGRSDVGRRPESRTLPARPADAYRGDLERAIGDIDRWRQAGYRGRRAAHRPRPGRADARGARRARRPGAARRGPRTPRRPRRRRRDGDAAAPSTTASSTTRNRLVVLTGEDLSGPAGLDPRHAQDARAPQAPDRPARAQRRRLRRPRAARRRPVRRDEAARGRGSGARVPRPRVRRLQARRPAGPALRPGRRARPGHPVRRRRAAVASTGSAAPTGPSARTRPARRSARSPPS